MACSKHDSNCPRAVGFTCATHTCQASYYETFSQNCGANLYTHPSLYGGVGLITKKVNAPTFMFDAAVYTIGRGVELLREVEVENPILYLASHSNCWEYRKSGIIFDDSQSQEEMAFHCEELHTAENILYSAHPSLKNFIVELVYLDRNLQIIDAREFMRTPLAA